MTTKSTKDGKDAAPMDELRHATEVTAWRDRLAASEACRAQLVGIVVPMLTRARATIAEAARHVAEAVQADRQSGIESWRSVARDWEIPERLVEQYEQAVAAIEAAAAEHAAFADAIKACETTGPTPELPAEMQRLLEVAGSMEARRAQFNGARDGDKITSTPGLRGTLTTAKHLGLRRGAPIAARFSEPTSPKRALTEFAPGMPRS